MNCQDSKCTHYEPFISYAAWADGGGFGSCKLSYCKKKQGIKKTKKKGGK